MTGITQLFVDIKNRLLSIADVVNASSFSGVGVNDANFIGLLTETTPTDYSETFVITIDGVGAIDTFSVSSSKGAQSNIAITGKQQWIGRGFSVVFLTTTGHTLSDSWTLSVTGTQLIKFCQIWNNQTSQEKEGQLYDYPKPAVFVEITNQSDIQELGNGSQIYNDLLVRLHIVHEFYNSVDEFGIEEQDLTIFDLTQRCYFALNKFEPTGAVALVRSSEQQQFDHANIYEFVQEYRTNLIDPLLNAPVYFIVKQPTTDYHLDVFTTDPDPVIELLVDETFNGVYLNLDSGKMVIDWGDGSIEESTTVGIPLYAHAYTTKGSYLIKVYGSGVTAFLISGLNHYLKSANKVAGNVDWFQIDHQSNLVVVDLSLASMLTELYCSNNASLLSINTSGLEKLIVADISLNPHLQSFDISVMIKLNNFVASGCAFNVNSVNSFLEKLDTFGSFTGTTQMFNQTPLATPTGQGIISKNNLIAKGWNAQTD